MSAQNATRFDNAVTQLKSTDLPLQILGAISIFTDLIKQDGFYWPTVAEVTEYLRLAARQKGDINRPEVINALVLISERDWLMQSAEPFPLDFSVLDLHNLQFTTLQLWGSNFRDANLSGAILPGAKLEGADLFCGNLQNAQFQMSSLSKATTPSELGPKLANVNFRNANLSNVVFKPDANGGVETDGACFEGANLKDADISHLDLRNVPGMALEQIQMTNKQSRPTVPVNFVKRQCESFSVQCPQTPGSK